MTSEAEEREALALWRPIPDTPYRKRFEKLVENEFLPSEESLKLQNRKLKRLARFAVSQVPYYGKLCEKMNLRPRDFASITDLPRLPVLTRHDLLDNAKLLKARRLPAGHRLQETVSSSGTTGRKTRVLVSDKSTFMYTLLLQRRYRWARYDPMKTFAEIRAPNLLPLQADGRPCQWDSVLKIPRWRYIGRFFESGNYVGFTLAQPLEKQLEILSEHNPAYICSYSGVLEEIAFSCVDRPPCEGLEGVISLASQLTPAMRDRIVATFGVPIAEGYGLNEIGIVATRCEADRFHVHPEHSIVEIVDDDGQPCQPGKTGRIVVTALQNPAMPLFRYDTDDVAEAIDSPCPCGRTMPSFVGLWGRLRRYAVLPTGTRQKFNVLSEALDNAPPQMLSTLRRYQIHQYRNGNFELRVVSPVPMPDKFHRYVNETWEKEIVDNQSRLDIVAVEDIPLGPSGKRLDFTSDYFDDIEQQS